MKKLMTIIIGSFLLISCGYSKEKEVRRNAVTGDVDYCIWIYRNGSLLDGISVPIEKANKKIVDSLNAKADEYIRICENAEKQ